MKENRIKRFNENSELNISDVRSSGLKIYYYSNSKDGINGSYVICISSSLDSAKKTIEKELNEMGLVFNDKIQMKINDIKDNDILYSDDGDF
jgi:hypothetical protein